jgi:hypothetical protein
MADRMDDVSQRVVRPTQGRHTIELIAGHTADGTIGLADVLVDGEPGEAIVLVKEVDARNPDAPLTIVPMVLILDDRWFHKVKIVGAE